VIKCFLESAQTGQGSASYEVSLTGCLRFSLRQIKGTCSEQVSVSDVALHETHATQADKTRHQVTETGEFVCQMHGPFQRRLQLWRREAVDGVQGRVHLQQDVELLFVTSAPRRLLCEELQTAAEAPHGLRVGEHGGSKLRSPSVVVPRAIGPPASVVLFGKLGGNVILPLCMENLETLCDPTMQ
jgi:hypothetical protein